MYGTPLRERELALGPGATPKSFNVYTGQSNELEVQPEVAVKARSHALPSTHIALARHRLSEETLHTRQQREHLTCDCPR